MERAMKDHVIICGLGTIGFQTFKLLKQANQKIITISDKIQNEWCWQMEEGGDIFYQGDARDDKLLSKAGIQNAKAILALTNQDMTNVAIVMEARKLNPNIKIILRMFDKDLGKHIAKAYGVHQVFSVDDLAAPIFASSAHENFAIAQFKIKERNYFVIEKHHIDKTKHSPLMTSRGNAEKQQSVFEKFLIVQPAENYKKKPYRFPFLMKKLNYLRSPVFTNFRRFLLIVFFIIFTSALILKKAMPLNFIDAFYFATTAITTVGYGDFNFSHAAFWLKIFGCFLMLTGAAALAMLFSSITEIILTKKLPSILGGQPVPKKDHIIVVGRGQFGHTLLSLLLADHLPVTIISESQNDRYGDDINRQVSLVEGHLKSRDTLKRARVGKAKAIIVITEDDVRNLSVSLAAKKINPNIFNVVHVFNNRLGMKLQSALSLDRVLSVPSIIAPYFAAAVFGEKILLALTWQNHLIFLSEVTEQHAASSKNCLQIEGKIHRN